MDFLRVSSALGSLILAITPSPAARAQQANIPTWSLSPAPAVSIGGDGTPVTEFLWIEATFRLRDGLIAVVNNGSNEIRLFDAQGKHVRTYGRRGKGPGEFTIIAWAGRSGDTAFVYDADVRRISSILLGREPRLLGSRTITGRGERGVFGVAGRLADGRWLVTTYTSPSWNGPPGVHRLPASVGVLGADAAGDVTWLAELPGMAIFVDNPTGDIKQAAVGPIAFSPDVERTASGGAVWYGESGSDSLIRYDARSGQRSTMPLPFASQAPTTALVAAARARELSTLRGGRGRSFLDAKFSSAYLPRTLPFFESLMPGLDGELWIQAFAGVPTTASRYLVVGSDLKSLAWVNVPKGFRIADVGHDFVLGVYQDDDGVESVRLYGLIRR